MSCKLGQPGFNFEFCPNEPVAHVFVILFGLTWVAHLFQAWRYRLTPCWILVMGGIWSFIASMTRAGSILNPFNHGSANASFTFFLLAPAWINAFSFVVLGRMVTQVAPITRPLSWSGSKILWAFLPALLITYVIQFGGGVASWNDNLDMQTGGRRALAAGAVLEEIILLLFFALAAAYLAQLGRQSTSTIITSARRVLFVLLASTFFLIFRVMYRIVIFAAALGSSVNVAVRTHESYSLVFDLAPLFLALFVWHLYHPGKLLNGKLLQKLDSEASVGGYATQNELEPQKQAEAEAQAM